LISPYHVTVTTLASLRTYPRVLVGATQIRLSTQLKEKTFLLYARSFSTS